MQTGFINTDLGAAHTARKHADFLGQPVAKGGWVTINEDAPVRVLDLCGEGQFVYERAEQLVTYFCCCVKKVCALSDLSSGELARIDELHGEGPRSGGGGVTSGAGAKRKEGVQPPGYSAYRVVVAV